MKQLLVTADDEKLGNVVVTQTNLASAERLLEAVGLGETTMGADAHHYLVGGLAYALSHPEKPLSEKEAVQFVKRNRSALGTLAKSIGK